LNPATVDDGNLIAIGDKFRNGLAAPMQELFVLKGRTA
jgi:hypothetical protein